MMKVPAWFKEGIKKGELNFNKAIDKKSNATEQEAKDYIEAIPND